MIPASLLVRGPETFSHDSLDDGSAAGVLAVDDQPAFLGAVSELVGATRGMVVVAEARSGERAVELAEQLKPDLVLMDVRMPGIGGAAAAREIKESSPSTIVALISATPPEDLAPETATARADALIWKSDLRPRMLEEIWQRYRPRRANETLTEG
jgi:two-component system, NarL family, invasion response regulator UvrY